MLPSDAPFLETTLALLAYGSESVALPSGNGGLFMTSGLRQKPGKCHMPGAHEVPRRKQTRYQSGSNLCHKEYCISDFVA
jgi:hypothetical protein